MAVDDELEQAHSLRLDGPVSASYSMGTSGGAKGRQWQNPFAERLIGSIRRDRRLERGGTSNQRSWSRSETTSPMTVTSGGLRSRAACGSARSPSVQVIVQVPTRGFQCP